jgi:hypothetical protein
MQFGGDANVPLAGGVFNLKLGINHLEVCASCWIRVLQRIAWVLTHLGESHQLSAISIQPKQEAEGRELMACTLAQFHCNPL